MNLTIPHGNLAGVSRSRTPAHPLAAPSSSPFTGTRIRRPLMILPCCRTLFPLCLLLGVLWSPPVGAQPELVKDINLLHMGSSPRGFVAIANVVYFVADNRAT